MEIFVSVIKNGKTLHYPLPIATNGAPLFIPRRGEQLHLEDVECVVEGVKYYVKDGEWVAAVFAHEIVH